MRRFSLANPLFLLVIAILFLSSCAGGPPAAVKQRGLISAASDVNPDRAGQASPVSVLLFFLTDTQSFRSADFFGLYQNASQVLGDSLLESSRFQVVPGEQQQFVSEFPENVRAIGVIAAFRDIETAQWRSSLELPKVSFFSLGSNQVPILISVEKLQVTLSISP